MKKLRIVAYTLLYYSTSLTLGFFTSYFLNEKEYNFRYPLFIAGCQNVVHFALATVVLSSKGIGVSSAFSFLSLPCAAAAAVDIGVSSYSLRNISLAFYTMIKSSTPVFILLCGFAFGIEKPSIFLFLVMFTIGCGVFLMSMINTRFNMYGFGLVSVASFMAGFRWAFVQYIVEKKRARRSNVVATIQELCLPISILLLVSSSTFEGIREILRNEFLVDAKKAVFNGSFIFISGCISFALLLSEFALVDNVSVIYLSMSGIVKELIIVVFSVLRHKIILSRVNVVGLFISIVGIVIFNLTSAKEKPMDEEKLAILADQEVL